MKNSYQRYISMLFLFISLYSIGVSQSDPVMIKQWGEYGDKPGQFKFPTMMAVDSHSDLYVVDQHNQRIQKFDSTGKFILMWGTAGSKNGEFNYPYGIAIDSNDNVFVSDMDNNRIQKFSSQGKFLASVGSYGSETSEFKYPYGIAIDRNDILYVIDALNYRIQIFDTNLKFRAVWGSEETIGIKLYMPHEIAIAGNGNVLLSDRQNHKISVFTKEGKLVKRFGEYGEGTNIRAGLFSEPHGLTTDSEGNIFVCDRYNFRIQEFNSDGIPQSSWVTSGSVEDSKHFPIDVVCGKDGIIYVSDHYAHCIQKYKR